MTEPEYRGRLSLWRRGEDCYRLDPDGVRVAGPGRARTLAFAEVAGVRVYESPGLGGIPGFARCVVWPRRGRAVVLSSNHVVGIGRFEDRSATFRPFVDALVRRIAAANAAARFAFGMPRALWWSWIGLLAAVALVAPLSLVLVASDLARGRGVSAGAVMPLAIVAVVFLGLSGYIRHLRHNKPRRFDPRAAGWPGLWTAW